MVSEYEEELLCKDHEDRIYYDNSYNLFAKFSQRIHLDELVYHSNSITSSLQQSALNDLNHNIDYKSKMKTDKSQRATVEQVLDPKTRLVLFKMLNKGIIYSIYGCISTGKEANVYHAISEDGQHRALKIYKTSILTFKDRDRYVTGEFRFRHGYSRTNPRKMVKVWAEKEMRNLKRLVLAGIPCPEPIELRLHVLLMSFLGNDQGWPAPRLKDANISQELFPSLYRQCLLMIRIMFHECRLIHADLSEYNMLYFNEKLYIIDVSQSVEHDHPHALDFLRKDIANINDFFSTRGQVHVLSLRKVFDFVTDLNISKEDHRKASEQSLDYLLESVKSDSIDVHQDSVFLHSYIPRTLDQVVHVERDVNQVVHGNTEELLYSKLAGLIVNDKTNESKKDNVDEACQPIKEKLTHEQLKEHRKQNKKLVKEENRERRQSKMKKSDKKKKIKDTKGKHSHNK